MTKSLNISLIPALILAAFLILSVFAALPARAQEIKEQCTLSRNITIEGKTILKGATVKESATVSVRDTGFVPVAGENAVKEWGAICLVNTVNTVTDWLFFILISIAFIFILIAGFLWMTAGGQAEKQKQAAQMIGAALAGIVIAILARIIPAVLIGILA